MTLSPYIISALVETQLDPSYVESLVHRTLAEDLTGNPEADFLTGKDVTSLTTIPETHTGKGELVARAGGVLAGLSIAAAVFDVASEGQAAVSFHLPDATPLLKGDVLATVTGPTRALLSAERSALNLLCRASGVATHTFLWSHELKDTKTTVLDTRKTTPGLRALEKYAVRCGGGANKRSGLYDIAMIKDNHIIAAGGITAAFEAVNAQFPTIEIQVEVTNLAEAREAVDAGATYLLCDNMSVEALQEVVAQVGSDVELEATGGLTLDQAKAYAATGVNYLSIGGLTHSSPIVDIALDLK